MYLLLKFFDIDYSSARTYKSFDIFDGSLPFESYEFRQDHPSVVDFKCGDNDCDKTLPPLMEGVMEELSDVIVAKLK